MKVELRKWGNSLGLRIPSKLAQSLGLDENSVVELIEVEDQLILRKKEPTLEEILASIPEGFKYPDDLADFVESEPKGDELL
jgi:antitoxin MazE